MFLDRYMNLLWVIVLRIEEELIKYEESSLKKILRFFHIKSNLKNLINWKKYGEMLEEIIEKLGNKSFDEYVSSLNGDELRDFLKNK